MRSVAEWTKHMAAKEHYVRALKVVAIAGTRPEWIRLSATLHALDRAEDIELVIVHTGQNYDFELNQVFFEDLRLRRPDHFLNAAGETASETIGTVISRVDKVLRAERPDAALILGDTNSCMAALAARKNHLTVYHMEAGNRCFDFNVPEELNRRLVDHMSDFNLCYTEHARRQLLSEGLPHRRIYVTGSPMNEVLSNNRAHIDASKALETLDLTAGKYFVASFHREENVDREEPLRAIVDALETLSSQHEMPVIVSTHPRTRKRLEQFGISAGERLRFLKPFGFHDYNKLQLEATCVISDSGTISEEASILGFPAITIRNALERPEAMDTGSIILTGLDALTILRSCNQVISDFALGHHPPRPADYQITNTSQRVVRLITGTAKLSGRWYGLEAASSVGTR